MTRDRADDGKASVINWRRPMADSVYSIEVVRKLFASPGTIVARVVWDRDDDIQSDIESDDKERRRLAKAFQKSGLTKEYMRDNVDVFARQFRAGMAAAGLKAIKPSVEVDVDSLEVLVVVETPSRMTFPDVIAAFHGSGMNINEGVDIYVQMEPYVQISDIRFRSPDGSEYPIGHWKILEAIHRMDGLMPALRGFKATALVPNSIYEAINGALVFVTPKREWSDGKPVGRLITHKEQKVTWGEDLEFSKRGAVDGLEVPEFLPYHPDSVFGLVRLVCTVPDTPMRMFGGVDLSGLED